MRIPPLSINNPCIKEHQGRDFQILLYCEMNSFPNIASCSPQIFSVEKTQEFKQYSVKAVGQKTRILRSSYFLLIRSKYIW